MAAALLDLEHALRDLERVLHSEKEHLTTQETDILFTSRKRAMRDFDIGAFGTAIVTWLGAGRLNLNLFSRLTLPLGAAFTCGFWRLKCSLESSHDRILSLEGTRIQRELANILVQSYSHQPWVLERLSKYFYCEKVYDDSTADKPKFQWRFRNFFGDPATYSLETEGTNSSNTDDVKTTTTRTTTVTQQANVIAVGGDMENPFDIIFGVPGIKETPHDPPHTHGESCRRQARREKRAQI